MCLAGASEHRAPGPRANCTQSFWVPTGVTDTGEEAPAGGQLEAREGEGCTWTPQHFAECRSWQSMSCQHADCQLQPFHFHYIVFKDVTFSIFRKSKLHFLKNLTILLFVFYLRNLFFIQRYKDLKVF